MGEVHWGNDLYIDNSTNYSKIFPLLTEPH